MADIVSSNLVRGQEKYLELVIQVHLLLLHCDVMDHLVIIYVSSTKTTILYMPIDAAVVRLHQRRTVNLLLMG